MNNLSAMIDTLRELITPERVFFLQFAYGCMVQNLPDPDAASGKLYRCFFGTVHSLAGNTGLVRRTWRQRRQATPETNA